MERKVKIRAFSYTEKNGKKVKRVRVARGETHDFPEDAIEAGEAMDAFFSEDDGTEDGEGTAAFDFSEASVEDIAEYIEEEHPTVQELIDATEGNTEVAQKILDAENAATGQDPRKTLVEGLAEVIGRGSE